MTSCDSHLKQEKYLRKLLEFYEQFTTANRGVASVRRELSWRMAAWVVSTASSVIIARLRWLSIRPWRSRRNWAPVSHGDREPACLAEVHAQQGVACLPGGQSGAAISELTEAIRLDPKARSMADSYRGEDVCTGRRVIWSSPSPTSTLPSASTQNTPQAFNARGMAYTDKGDLDQAIADFKEAIRLAPKIVYPYNNLGYVYQKQGNIDDAVRVFSDAIRIDPGNRYHVLQPCDPHT